MKWQCWIHWIIDGCFIIYSCHAREFLNPKCIFVNDPFNVILNIPWLTLSNPLDTDRIFTYNEYLFESILPKICCLYHMLRSNYTSSYYVDKIYTNKFQSALSNGYMSTPLTQQSPWRSLWPPQTPAQACGTSHLYPSWSWSWRRTWRHMLISWWPVEWWQHPIGRGMVQSFDTWRCLPQEHIRGLMRRCRILYIQIFWTI